MSVLEAPIDENRRMIRSHHDVWLPRYSFHVESIPISVAPQPSSHQQFRFCVAGVYVRHAEVALGGGEAVGHGDRIL